jgi:hypothetical protein
MAEHIETFPFVRHIMKNMSEIRAISDISPTPPFLLSAGHPLAAGFVKEDTGGDGDVQ